MYEDLLRVVRGYPDIQLRFVVSPTEEPPNTSTVPIFATKEEMRAEV